MKMESSTTGLWWSRSHLLHVVGAIAMICTVSLGVYGRNLIANQVQQLDNDAVRYTKLNSLTSNVEQNLEEAREKQLEAETIYQSVVEQIPQRLVDADILGRLHQLTDRTQCELNEFRPVGSQDLKYRGITCRTRTFQLKLNGSFASIQNFTALLHELPNQWQIRRSRVSEANTPPGHCQMELDLAIAFDLKWTETNEQ